MATYKHGKTPGSGNAWGRTVTGGRGHSQLPTGGSSGVYTGTPTHSAPTPAPTGGSGGPNLGPRKYFSGGGSSSNRPSGGFGGMLFGRSKVARWGSMGMRGYRGGWGS